MEKIIITFAGNGSIGFSGDGDRAEVAQTREPNGCVLDGNRRILIADVQGQRIHHLDLESGMISTFAGTGAKAHDRDAGPASKAAIFGARTVCIGPLSDVYICKREGNSIRQIDSYNSMHLVAGTYGTFYIAEQRKSPHSLGFSI